MQTPAAVLLSLEKWLENTKKKKKTLVFPRMKSENFSSRNKIYYENHINFLELWKMYGLPDKKEDCLDKFYFINAQKLEKIIITNMRVQYEDGSARNWKIEPKINQEMKWMKKKKEKKRKIKLTQEVQRRWHKESTCQLRGGK